MKVESFLEIARGYRAVFFDSYGVLRVGDHVLPGVAGALAALEAAGIPYWVLTNDASRDRAGVAAAFNGLIPTERFVSSGQMLVEFLQREPPPGLLAYLGPARAEPLLALAGCPFRPLRDLETLDGVAAIALMDEEGFDWERELNRVVNYARAHPELRIYVPNPDLVYPTEAGVGLAAGALAALLEAVLGTAPLAFGKPAAPIFHHSLELARAELGELSPSEVLMVGDTLTTDVRGGQAVGLATALVLSGNTTPEALQDQIAASGLRPDHLCSEVRA
ncbi:MAG: HAD-IIA family hydrolase [Planctomycetes bacterium]|nr:HAD-IIA family hydrolase [Planctomycetota bacterium]